MGNKREHQFEPVAGDDKTAVLQQWVNEQNCLENRISEQAEGAQKKRYVRVDISGKIIKGIKMITYFCSTKARSPEHTNHTNQPPNEYKCNAGLFEDENIYLEYLTGKRINAARQNEQQQQILYINTAKEEKIGMGRMC